jgi:dynein heavy chain
VLENSYEDSTPLIPLYFILSPGSDVVSDVDKLAVKYGMIKDITYFSISLGQGQDIVAADRLEAGSGQGFWVFLNNVHLMPKWLSVLEKKLDDYAWMGAHPEFRIMLSSDPSSAIPVSILDRAIKITSDPPSGLKANLKQAFTCFSKDMYEDLEPRTKGILFGLCQFHAVMVERKKFGPKGFNMPYPFSLGDLVNSSSVLRNYMESAPAKVPWADLRYLFGEIMYGGHIINDFDRTLANTYMEFFMREDLLDEMILYPFPDGEGRNPDSGLNNNMEMFRTPSTTSHYEKVLDHIDESMRIETPIAYGLHPNAELGFRVKESENLIAGILELSLAKDSDRGSSNDSMTIHQAAEAIIQDVQETFRDVRFDLPSSVESSGPYQFVLQQECDHMNILILEIMESLTVLNSGFKGDVTMTDSMEDLKNCLYLNRVPKSWEGKAYPSQKPLGSWLTNLQSRCNQLNEWASSTNDVLLVTWISGLFNPQSFLTAVMQATAQAQGLELDKLSLITEVTRRMVAEEVTAPAKDGTYIVGLSLEGASWSTAHTNLESSKPREMFCSLPVINIRPAVVDKLEQAAIYMCPVYKTQQRGSTGYVFSLQLKTKLDRGKWALAGVAAIMDVVK